MASCARRLRGLDALGRDATEEVVGDAREVADALAERRDLERDAAEAVVEVLAELAALDHRLQIAVRRADDPAVGADGGRAADALERALLEDAEERDLRARRDVADLVEEERAALGHLEAAAAARGGARERALLVAEELGEEERLDEGRAVDRDERRRWPRSLARWSASATSSLPVPLSPRTRTVLSVRGDLADGRDERADRGVVADDARAPATGVALRWVRGPSVLRCVGVAAARSRPWRAEAVERLERGDVAAREEREREPRRRACAATASRTASACSTWARARSRSPRRERGPAQAST